MVVLIGLLLAGSTVARADDAGTLAPDEHDVLDASAGDAEPVPASTTSEDAAAQAPIDAGADATDEPTDEDDSVAEELEDAGAEVDAGTDEVEPTPASSTEPPPSDDPAAPALEDVPIAKPPTVEPTERPAFVIKTILGLLGLLALAYVGGHPRVQQWERKLGVAQLVTAGFPFVALGLVARAPSVGILTDSVLAALGPLLRVGLGWIGFVVGFRFDARMLANLPKGMGTLVSVRALVTFLAIASVSIVVLRLVGALPAWPWSDPMLLRDGVILATAGLLTSRTTPSLLEKRGGHPESVSLVQKVLCLEEIAGVFALLVIAAYFRPHGAGVSWQLPATGWLVLTLGAGVAVGLVVYAILLQSVKTNAESLVLILGSVAFASGLAANLRMSPVVVCFVAGLLLANFPGEYKARLGETLERLERPVYHLFLVVVGALWRIEDGLGWGLMVAFVVARLFGKAIGTRLGAASGGVALRPDGRRALVVAPIGALSIAVVINARVLYPSGSTSIVTPILGGAVVTELLIHALTRATARENGDGPRPASSGEGAA